MKHLNNTHLVLSVVLVLFASACTPAGQKSVEDDVAQSVATNTESKSMIDWESSGQTPEEKFAKWRDEKVKPEDLCAVLTKRTGHELSLFEEEIKNEENKDLLAPCKDELKEILEKYWKDERAKIGVDTTATETAPAATTVDSADAEPVQDIAGAMQFPETVVTRDFSNGLFIVNGDLGAKQVVLTFDDGPHGEYTDRILATLAKFRAKAIFLATGRSVRAYPEALRRVAKAGHSVGSHSMTHKCLAFKKICAKNNGTANPLSFAAATAEIVGGHQAVYNVLGWVDPYFRFPYGESSPELKKYLQQRSTGEFYWSVDSNDWKNQSTQNLVDSTMSQVRARNKGVILFHDVHRRTAEALPEILRQLYVGGFTVVSMRPSDPKARFNSKIVQRSGVAGIVNQDGLSGNEDIIQNNDLTVTTP